MGFDNKKGQGKGQQQGHNNNPARPHLDPSKGGKSQQQKQQPWNSHK